MQDIDWNDLRFALAVHRTGGFSAAARLLHVNETTVSRRIAALERRLGTVLVEKGRRAAGLTAAGQLVAEHAARAEAALSAAVLAVGGQDAGVAGEVRLTAVPLIVNRVLARALPALVNAHPGLEVDLIAEPRELSLGQGDAEIAIRLARPSGDLEALARKVTELEHGIFVGRGKRMVRLPWLIYDTGMDHLPQNGWIRANMAPGEEVARVRVNDAEGLIACCARGLGKIVLPRVIGRQCPELEDSGAPCDLRRDVWMLIRPESRRLARIATVADWARQAVGGPAAA